MEFDVGQIIQFLMDHKWTIAVLIPAVLAIIVIKIRG